MRETVAVESERRETANRKKGGEGMTENQVEIKRGSRRETQKGWTGTQYEVTGADKDFRFLGCHRVEWYVQTFRRSFVLPSSVSSIILDI